MEERFSGSQYWSFVNMNSPADLGAQWTEAGSVCLKEYDRCRDGHCLLSGFFLNSRELEIEATVKSQDDGFAVGVYYGDGCWDKYLGVFVSRDEIQVRIPSNIPLGDTFRFEGPKRYYVLESHAAVFKVPATLRISILGKELHVFLNDLPIISCNISGVSFIQPAARVFLKAVNENAKTPVAGAEFENIRVKGFAELSQLKGIVTEVCTGIPVEGASVHIAGYSDLWTVSGADGRFVFPGLPTDRYCISAAKEAMDFTVMEVEHPGNSLSIALRKQTEEHMPRNEEPGINLWSSNLWGNLNGTWSFTFDPENEGEAREWYADDHNLFTRTIQVPFSWASLEGFGEGFLAKDHSIHQFNTFIADTGTVGNIGWYKRDICIPDSFDEERQVVLNIGAVTGLAKVWLDGVYVGESVEQYSIVRFPLGQLKNGSVHRLVIRVDADVDRYHLCSGKQGFWFSRCPGIWQNVWLENSPDLGVKELSVEYEFLDDALKSVELNITAVFELLPGQNDKVLDNQGFSIDKGTYEDIQVDAPETGIYRLAFEYSAGQGLTAVQFETADSSFCAIFHGTPDYEHKDVKEIFIRLTAGRNNIRMTGISDERMYGSAICRISKVMLQKLEEPDSVEINLYDNKMKAVFAGEIAPEICKKTGIYQAKISFTLDGPDLWDPDAPELYKAEALINKKNTIQHKYSSTFGIRQVKCGWAPGHSPDECEISQQYQYFYINNKIVYIRGVLDQGYNPWGIYTYPYGRELIKGSMGFDIEAARICGYNLIRMHIKDNEPLWYRICDEAGMLVWDELPPNFYEKASNPAWRGMFFRQLDSMIRKHRAHPSVIMFSAFNESWGIEGWHERSPWEDEAAQNFIRTAVRQYKDLKGNVLVVDNSGYGKTAETDMIDHHSYPNGYSASKDFWMRLIRWDFPGSYFNFYNKLNRNLMLKPEIRDLLQRNCSQPLNKLDFKGDDHNCGQPVLISEFVHTNRNTKLMRIFDKIAGYVRMNLASQENEDTSPLTALRNWRDFGYVDEKLSPLNYSFNNSINSIVIDGPQIARVKSGQNAAWEVYGSVWEHELNLNGIRMEWTVTGIDPQGRYIPDIISKSRICSVKRYEPGIIGTVAFQIPENITGLYIFVKISTEDRILASDYIQLEVFCDGFKGSIDPNSPLSVVGNSFWGSYGEGQRKLFWMSGYGSAVFPLDMEAEVVEKLSNGLLKGAILHLEASSCQCLDGTLVTDEEIFQSELSVSVNGWFIGKLQLRDHPSDERALFSNSASMHDQEFNYEKSGRFGYGEKLSLSLNQEVVELIKNCAADKLPVNILFQAGENGMVLYGQRMGRFGFDPYIEWLEP